MVPIETRLSNTSPVKWNQTPSLWEMDVYSYENFLTTISSQTKVIVAISRIFLRFLKTSIVKLAR